jgi:hypothetical protein
MKFNRYYIWARLVPTILCSSPIFLFQYYYSNKYLADLSTAIFNAWFVGPITLPIALIYFLVQVNRFVGKEVFERTRFKKELYMPTTNFLLHADAQYTTAYKKNIYARISHDFNIRLASPRQEQEDEVSARKKIVEAVSLMRTKTQGRPLLLQHNIEYGFARNMIGGSLVALLLCLFDTAFFKFVAHVNSAVLFSLVLAGIYLIPVLLASLLMERYGELYAKFLIQEYMYLSIKAND